MAVAWSCASRLLRGASRLLHLHPAPGCATLHTAEQRPGLLALVSAALPMRAEPKKKKKADPRREQLVKERLKKKLKRMEKVPAELIPVMDFVTPSKYLDETRRRENPSLSPEETERRTLLGKAWSRYKAAQHRAEMAQIARVRESQRRALLELQLESPRLYEAAVARDPALFPLHRDGPAYTPAIPGYMAPDGKYVDTTPRYVQM
ncbi:large ribosomal subunit protein mL40 isoform X1 [Petromyzon marinus]|uniref:Large ribosomal subunit protein mL40 n=2 Tax=Petromyzon marinus TaxID=7757 RepID=A0AAJ7U6X2_PETMA|nr:39S ribosomal protein L40, mitochondrial isoform X1 [Petromyzon marinus]XP_032830983.1 39S ribosomal protein L40, mitochondrial isoform X1 [Petromyzon marinus]